MPVCVTAWPSWCQASCRYTRRASSPRRCRWPGAPSRAAIRSRQCQTGDWRSRPDRPGKVDLLHDGDHAHAALTQIGQHIDASLRLRARRSSFHTTTVVTCEILIVHRAALGKANSVDPDYVNRRLRERRQSCPRSAATSANPWLALLM